MLKFATAIRNASLDVIETTIGAGPLLRIHTGAPPATVAEADPATTLAEIPLPADWMAPAANGSKAMAGTWSTTGLVEGDAGHFRIVSAGNAPMMQGTVGESGADMIIDAVRIKVGQTVVVRTFTLTDGNA